MGAPGDVMDEPFWVPRVVVDAVHHQQLQEHGGAYGVRSERAIEATLARARQRLAYDSAAELADLAASYAHGFATAHPFSDGNKRVAFLVAAIFLELNGFELARTDEEVVTTMRALAASTLGEPGFARWIREALVPRPPGKDEEVLRPESGP